MADESCLLRVAHEVLARDDVVLEAGGGQGWLALQLVDLCGMVWTVEADPDCYQTLFANVWAQHHVVPMFGALTLANGSLECPFYRAKSDPSGSSLIPMSGGEELMVPVVDAGVLIRERGVTAMVLDIEGTEYELLANLTELPMLRALAVEWHPEGVTPERAVAAESAIAAAGLVLAVEDLELPFTPSRGYKRV